MFSPQILCSFLAKFYKGTIRDIIYKAWPKFDHISCNTLCDRLRMISDEEGECVNAIITKTCQYMYTDFFSEAKIKNFIGKRLNVLIISFKTYIAGTR